MYCATQKLIYSSLFINETGSNIDITTIQKILDNKLKRLLTDKTLFKTYE